jgi:pimeloyl-ACP methyl ester carboxylesterase
VTWSDFFVEHEGRRIAVRDYGGEGPALLLLHGGGGNVAGWETLAPYLVPECSVVAYDAAGHGASDWVDSVGERGPAEVATVCGALAIDDPILVGSSMGGATAAMYAARGGECAGIVALDGVLSRTRDELARPPQELEDFAREMRESGWGFRGTRAKAEKWIEETAAGEGPPFEAHLRRSLRPADGDLVEQRPTIEQAWAMRLSPDELPLEERTVEIYDRIECPVLLLCATGGISGGGPYTDAQRERVDALPGRRPNIEARWIESGHLIHWEHPKVVANLIREFVSRA